MGVNEKLIWTETYVAEGDFSSKQYYGCKHSGNREVNVMAADTDIPAGLILNKPDTTKKQALVLIMGRAPGVCAETLTAGQLVRIDSAGKVALWETSDTTTYCVGQCVEGATVSGDAPLGVFDFNFANPFHNG